MTDQMATLLRVKHLKQEQAFRTLQAKRRQHEDAARIMRDAQVEVRRSAETLPAREDAIFDDILGRVIKLDDLDATHARVVSLQKDHERLENDRDRAVHVEDRVRREAEAASESFRVATKVRDKYAIITDDLRRIRDEAADAREEGEVEEMFSKPRKAVG